MARLGGQWGMPKLEGQQGDGQARGQGREGCCQLLLKVTTLLNGRDLVKRRGHAHVSVTCPLCWCSRRLQNSQLYLGDIELKCTDSLSLVSPRRFFQDQFFTLTSLLPEIDRKEVISQPSEMKQGYDKKYERKKFEIFTNESFLCLGFVSK